MTVLSMTMMPPPYNSDYNSDVIVQLQDVGVESPSFSNEAPWRWLDSALSDNASVHTAQLTLKLREN